MSPTTRPLSPHLGVEIIGIDLNQPLSDADKRFITDNWIEHGVLLFRNPAHTDEAHMRLSELFGHMEPGAVKLINDPANPYLMTLEVDPDQDQSTRGTRTPIVNGQPLEGWLGWHWDQSFMPEIVRGAVLRMIHPASERGQTGWIDGIWAYETLPQEVKDRIDGLEVVYHFNPDMASGQFGFPQDITYAPMTEAQRKLDAEFRAPFPEVVHPLVITQVETGRKILKLSPMHSRYVLGMDRAQSDALLSMLARHMCDESRAYWHNWQTNDMVAWDNWRVIHAAAGVPRNVRRVGKRTTIAGDYKVGRYLDPANAGKVLERIVD